VLVPTVGTSGVEVDIAVAVVGKVSGEEGVDLGLDCLFRDLAAKEGPTTPAHVGVLG
jgi:hypothetical protein